MIDPTPLSFSVYQRCIRLKKLPNRLMKRVRDFTLPTIWAHLNPQMDIRDFLLLSKQGYILKNIFLLGYIYILTEKIKAGGSILF